MRRLLIGCLFAAGCGSSGAVEYRGTVHADVHTPDLVYVSPGVQVIADYDEPIFYADDYYWRYDDGRWYRSHSYRGGWVYATPPRAIARIDRPYAYVRYRPQGHVSRRPTYRSDARDHRNERPIIRDHRDDDRYDDTPRPYTPAPQRTSPDRSTEPRPYTEPGRSAPPPHTNVRPGQPQPQHPVAPPRPGPVEDERYRGPRDDRGGAIRNEPRGPVNPTRPDAARDRGNAPRADDPARGNDDRGNANPGRGNAPRANDPARGNDKPGNTNPGRGNAPRANEPARGNDERGRGNANARDNDNDRERDRGNDDRGRDKDKGKAKDKR